MIWQDGYVAYVCEWKMVGERESRVLGRKETPKFQKAVAGR